MIYLITLPLSGFSTAATSHEIVIVCLTPTVDAAGSTHTTFVGAAGALTSSDSAVTVAMSERADSVPSAVIHVM